MWYLTHSRPVEHTSKSNGKGCSEAGLEAQTHSSHIRRLINQPWLLSPTSHPLSRAAKSEPFPQLKETLFSACKIVSGPAHSKDWENAGNDFFQVGKELGWYSAENRWIMSSDHDQCVQLRSFLLVMVVIDSLDSSHNYLNACLIDSARSLMIWSKDTT